MCPKTNNLSRLFRIKIMQTATKCIRWQNLVVSFFELISKFVLFYSHIAYLIINANKTNQIHNVFRVLKNTLQVLSVKIENMNVH